MKNFVIALSMIALAFTAMAQSPQAFTYQTVIRDGDGELLQNQTVTLRMSIHDIAPDGTILYRETHSGTTNQFGLISLEIGNGTADIGTFPDIDWRTSSKYLEIEIDPEGGNNFTSLGTSQLVSVPYALHAETVTNADDDDADSTNELQIISKAGNEVTLSQDGGSFTDEVEDADANSTNELNTAVVLDGTELLISDAGGTINTDLGALVDDADADPENEMQTLQIDGFELSISNGNEVPLPSGMPSGTAGQTINHDGNDWAACTNLYNDGTNVGIGTNSPSSKLEVAGTLRASKFVDGQNTDYYLDPDNEDIAAVIKGSVGIGNSPYWSQWSPTVPGWGPDLHINTGQDTANLWIGGNMSTQNAEIGQLCFVGEWSNTQILNAKGKFAGIGARVISTGSQSNYPKGALVFYTATGDPFTLPPSGTGFDEHMRITHEGFVGIGTADPWYKLHVEEGSIYADNPGGGGEHGVHVENAGGHGFHVWEAGTHGLNVHHSGNHGVNVAESDEDGLHVAIANNCGVDAFGYNGNHLRSGGTGSYGLYVHSLWDEATNPGLFVHGTAYITGDLTAPSFNGNGSAITNLNASNVNSGTLDNSRFNALSDLGGGSGTTFLRKDGTWANPPSNTYSAGNDLSLSGNTFSLENDIDLNYVRATSSSGLKLFDDGDNGIYIKDGGNVGIGVSNPSEKLEVDGKVTLSEGGNSTTLSNSNGALQIESTYPNVYGNKLRLTLYEDDVYFQNTDSYGGKFIFSGGAGQDLNGDIIFKTTGDVGIGTNNPSYKLHVNGTAYATGAAGALSDRRHKTNIHSLSSNVLADINKLRPVSYEWIDPLDDGMQGTQLGFIAQEVEEVVPGIVLTLDNEENTKALKYNEFIPLLVKAVQELKAENQALKARIEKLEND